jgi:flagellar basal-body rod protein FlgB
VLHNKQMACQRMRRGTAGGVETTRDAAGRGSAGRGPAGEARMTAAQPRGRPRGKSLPPCYLFRGAGAPNTTDSAAIRPTRVREFTVRGPNERSAAVGTALASMYPEEIRTMFDNIFGIHEQALAVHGQRLGVLAANIANADTPGYKARDIDFGEVLSQSGAEPSSLPLKITHAAQISFSDADSTAGELKYRNPYQASLDGNTVEMPVEQAAFAENNVRYQASLNFINLRIAEMQLAIAGQ